MIYDDHTGLPAFDEEGLLPLTFAQKREFANGIAELSMMLLYAARDARARSHGEQDYGDREEQ